MAGSETPSLLTAEEREELDDLFGYVPDPEPLAAMLAAVERIVREHTDRALAEVEQRIEALHVRHEGPVVEHGCVEGDCEHITDDEYDGPYPAPECPVLADAVCAYCADQTDPGDGWEHMIRPAAYWPCATIRHLRAARQEPGR